jgi:hypothetical protein
MTIRGRISRPVRTRNLNPRTGKPHVMPPGQVVRVVGYIIELDTPDGETWVAEAVQEDFTDPPDIEEFLKSRPKDS